MKKTYVHVVTVALLAMAGFAAYLAIARYSQDMTAARARYVETNSAETERYATSLSNKLTAIHRGLITLAWLPSVRGIDRHATNLSDEAKITFQQVYNTLAEEVLVSEVYLIPADFNPERVDPVTLKPEEPIIAFDQLIVDSGNGMSKIERQTHPDVLAYGPKVGEPEIEDFEYRQLVQQLHQARQNYATVNSTDGVNLPFIAGQEVITCDNTEFNTTHRDKDRSGIILSVPFYDANGALKGLVSAIIRTNALARMLPSPDVALVNAGTGFAVKGTHVAALPDLQRFVEAAEPAPFLPYSSVAPVQPEDDKNPWRVWSGKSGADFLATPAVKAAQGNFRNALAAIAVAFAVAVALAWLVRRNMESADRLAQSLKSQRDMAEAAERSARETAEKLAALNDNVSGLNRELAEKLKELAAAQDEIVRKGRMAQLGQLVATVAHEIRNPLGSVRTTLFVLKRKMKDQAEAFRPQFERMESGVSRCDAIISQLLDFSRGQALTREKAELSHWLQAVLGEEVAQLPQNLAVELILPEGPHEAAVDKERLRRCIINLLNNAADALSTPLASGATPRISVELAHSPRGTEITVADNGPGIPPEVMAKVGEPLFTTKSFGTGLGLAATRKVAELHGGGLEVASQPGQGARFTVWFPDEAEEEPSEEATVAA